MRGKAFHSTKLVQHSCVHIYSTTLPCANANNCPFLHAPWVAQYMLNDVLENRGISECNTCVDSGFFWKILKLQPMHKVLLDSNPGALGSLPIHSVVNAKVHLCMNSNHYALFVVSE